ncbi:MAG: pyruvate ferredoxin oxidoreductase [Chloroflexi bacterium]|nr:pyruvate ferredoxin oxidoreductase [Chloroflexota bacterium]
MATLMDRVITSKAAVLEGSRAIAEAVRLCRPQVISAYPITPQTHVVEALAQMVADGALKAEFVNVESEHSAASVVLGASATGARVYTASSSQGIALMSEVLFNIAGLRLPVVLTCANRALSSPLNIWNDQQDSLSVRDAGWVQLYVEDNQEAVDTHLQAYAIAEDRRVLLPTMVCADGFLLTHTYEPVIVPTQEEVDAFLPPYRPQHYLTPDKPLTMGAFADPEYYMESRYLLDRALERSQAVIEDAAQRFNRAFGRHYGGLLDTLHMEGARTAVVAMGSVVATLRDVVSGLRDDGHAVGLVKVRSFRPFPKDALRSALRDVDRVLVLERALSPGGVGILAAEVRAVLQGQPRQPAVSAFVAGLGGRDIPVETLQALIARAQDEAVEQGFADLKAELVEEGDEDES